VFIYGSITNDINDFFTEFSDYFFFKFQDLFDSIT